MNYFAIERLTMRDQDKDLDLPSFGPAEREPMELQQIRRRLRLRRQNLLRYPLVLVMDRVAQQRCRPVAVLVMA